jgi:hypothetical protein
MSTYDIITDTSVFADFVPIAYTFDIQEMKPHFEVIAETYIIPECGRTLWDEIIDAKESGEMTAIQKATLAAMQRPFANLCTLAQLPFLDAKISNGGITVTSSQDQAPASQYRVQAIKNQLWNSSYLALDRLIAFLIENEPALTNYDGTAYAEAHRSRILNRTEEASAYVPVINNRWLFRRMIPIIDRISKGRVKAVLTAALYVDIIRSIQEKDDPNIYADEVIPGLQNAIAHLSIAEAIVELGIQVTPEGIVTFSTSLGVSSDRDSAKLKNPELSERVAHHQRIGETQLQNVLDIVIADTAYTAYEAPEGYKQDHMPKLDAQTGDKIYSPFL